MFTDKERLVLMHLVQGVTDKQIASRTGMTISMVQAATKSIFLKLKVHNRTQVAVWVHAHGMNGKSVKNVSY